MHTKKSSCCTLEDFSTLPCSNRDPRNSERKKIAGDNAGGNFVAI